MERTLISLGRYQEGARGEYYEPMTEKHEPLATDSTSAVMHIHIYPMWCDENQTPHICRENTFISTA